MVRGTDDYTSVPLPGRFLVLAPDGELLPVDSDDKIPRATERRWTSVPSPLASPTKIAEEKATLIKTIKQLPRSADRKKSVELVVDTIFWRRVLYVLTLALTFYLAAFPLIGGAFTTALVYARAKIPYIGDLWKNLSRADEAMPPSVMADGPEVTDLLIPRWLNLWIERVTEHRVEAILIAASIVICLRLSSALQLRIHDLARAGWNEEFRNAYAGSRKDAKRAVVARAAIWVVVPLLGAFAAPVVAPDWIARTLFGVSGIACVFALLLLPRILEPTERNVMAFEASFAQKVARTVRTFPLLRNGYPLLTRSFVPALFAFVLVASGALLINRIAYVGLSGTKLFCRGSEKDARSVARPEEASVFQH